MRILFLCKKMYHDSKMSRSRLQYMETLGKRVEVVNDGPGFPSFSSARDSVDKYRPSLIVWYKPLSIPGFDKVPGIPKVLIYNEMYRVADVTAEILESDTRTMICHHANDIPLFKLPEEYRFHHVPHHIDPTIFFDRGEKNIDILLAGILAAKIYPFRARLAKMAHDGLFRKHRFVHYKHPGYRITNPAAQLDRFASYLSRAKIVLTCSSSFKYALAKYPEIMACGSAVAGDIPNERQSWFEKNMIVLSEDMTNRQIVDLIGYHLADSAKLKEVTKAGHDFTHANLTVEKWADKFMEIVNA